MRKTYDPRTDRGVYLLINSGTSVDGVPDYRNGVNVHSFDPSPVDFTDPDTMSRTLTSLP